MANPNNLIEGDWNEVVFKVKMQGETGIYTLGFSMKDNKKLPWHERVEHFCNCPYAQGVSNPCKHIVALAFLFRNYSLNFSKLKHGNLAINSQVNENFLKETTRLSSTPILLEQRQSSFNYLIDEVNLNATSVDTKKLMLDFEEAEIRASFFMDEHHTQKRAEVFFHSKGMKRSMCCSCAKEVKPFCEHESEFLALVLIHQPDLLRSKYVESELLMEKAKKVALSLGLLRLIYNLQFTDDKFSLKYVPSQEVSQALSRTDLPELIPGMDDLWEGYKVGEMPIIVWKDNYGNYAPRFLTASPKVRSPGEYKSFRSMDEKSLIRFNLTHLQSKLESLEEMDDQEGELALYRMLLLYWKQMNQYPQVLGWSEFYKVEYKPLSLAFYPALSYSRKDVEEFVRYELKVNGRGLSGSKPLLRAGLNRFYDHTNTLHIVNLEAYYGFLCLFDQEGKFVTLREEEHMERLETLFAELGVFSKPTKPKEMPAIADWKLQIYLSAYDEKFLAFGVMVSLNLKEEEWIKFPLFEALDYLLYTENIEEYEEVVVAYIQICALHPFLDFQNIQDLLRIPVMDIKISEFLHELCNVVEKNDWELFGQEIVNRLLKTLTKPQIRTRLFRAEEWFSMKVELKFDQEVVSIKQVLEAWKNGNRFILLKNGARGEIPEEWMKRFARYFSIADEKQQQIPKTLGHLIDSNDFTEVSGDAFEFLEVLHKKLEQPEVERQKLPKSVKAKLRPYQETSYHWMNQLADLEWGGILADDMGLGKTLQAITFMTKRLDDKKGPHLMVVPKSLLHNWENEWKHFTGKKPYIHFGADRIMDEKVLAKNPLTIISYGTLLRDSEVFSKIHFDVLVLDEAQAVKNPSTKSRKAVAALKAKVRLAMTGTPVENSLTDLYSILSLVVPGSLGSLKQFQSRFQSDKPGSLELLREMISPFILRRLKSQVATELPEKMVTHRIIDMDDEQAALYEQTRQHYLELFQDTEEGVWNKNGMLVLKGMNELRQICDAPAMLSGQSGQGAKIRELLYELEELVPNHKVLIFSQYVKMLKLVEHQIKQKGWGYVMLDGSTQKRGELVDTFQDDPNIRVFLISLKAGGSGLNLTQAEYVYILDPWWNPAAEEQAIDRAHRIGQQNKVMAIKFVCKGSIEEKVLEMQSHKKKLADSVISADDTIIKTLDKKKVLELFAKR